MERIVDLHIHTTCSDGALTPKQVVDMAVKNNVEIISIADHDSIMAYTEDFFQYAQNKGVSIIPAVEISTRNNGVGVHVLGYNFDLNNKELNNVLFKLKNARQDYLIDVTRKLDELGYSVNIEKLKEVSSVTKAHISQDIISNDNNREKLLENFGHIPNKGEFIETIMNEGCPAFVEKFSISSFEASNIIHSAGGIVILAHPVCYKYEDGLNLDQVVKMARDMKADGIESNYLYVDRYNNLIDEIDFWNKIAIENNMITSIGSDYHISDGIRPEIGFANYFDKLNNINSIGILDKIKIK